jgi:hypothetical protein
MQSESRFEKAALSVDKGLGIGKLEFKFVGDGFHS